MRILSSGWTAILLLAVFTFTSCDDDEDRPNNPVIGTISDIVADDTRFSILASALERASLDDNLDVATRSFTVFAPTDAAFQASGIDLNSVSDEALANVLLYHVLGASVRSPDIADGTSSVETLNTTGPDGVALPIRVDNSGGSISLNNTINVVEANVEAVNGVIHIIDNVLLPPSILDRARIDGRFNTLISALERTGLDDVVAGDGTFTVFAPTDAAFTEANIDLANVTDEDLTNLLLYHVLGATVPAGSIAAGDNFVTTLSEIGPNDTALSALVNNTDGTVTINDDATVVVPNVFATNGVVHAIDKVMSYQSIVDFAVKAQGTSSLEAALAGANLVDALSADGPFTVFAPTDLAFTNAEATIETLEPGQVANVLRYHVVPGNVQAGDIMNGSVGTLNGDQGITLNVDDGAKIIDGAGNTVDIILTDIQGTNGVIHLVNAVLIPGSL
ncbi:MAG: fasciclin domain-containing protein [Bacteroidota bacterium]